MDAHACNSTGAAHGSCKSYLIGFALSIVLTLIPFLLVMHGTLPKATILLLISVAALVQILVQLVIFLHLDTSSSQRWNLLAFALTALITLLLVGGSLWIMHNLNERMMDDDHVQSANLLHEHQHEH